MSTEETRRIAMQTFIESFPCPRCKAAAGSRCTGDRVKRPGQAHAPRIDRGLSKSRKLWRECDRVAWAHADAVTRGRTAVRGEWDRVYDERFRQEAELRGIAGVFR